MGTYVGTMVFVRYGWRASSALGMGWYAMQILVLLLRGPHCKRYTWVGYEGGARFMEKELIQETVNEKNSSAS